MEITREIVTKSIGSFVAVLIAFGGGWYYLDQQRIASFKDKEEAIKVKAEADYKEKYLKQYEVDSILKQKQITVELDLKQARLAKVESDLGEREKQFNHDKELNQLTVKFVDEMADVDMDKSCGDDQEHNAKVRRAKALLNLIEAKALQYNRQEVVDIFVKSYRQGINHWQAKCKSK